MLIQGLGIGAAGLCNYVYLESGVSSPVCNWITCIAPDRSIVSRVISLVMTRKGVLVSPAPKIRTLEPS